MPFHLRIDDDDEEWQVASDAAVVPAVEAAVRGGTAVAVDVVSPLAGRLLLNGAAVGRVGLLTTIPVSWAPSHLRLPSPRLRVLGSHPVTQRSSGWSLPAGTDLAALEAELLTAFGSATVVTVPLGPGGTLLLRGGSVAAVVLAPAGS